MRKQRRLTSEEQLAIIRSHERGCPTIANELRQAELLWFDEEELAKCRREDNMFRFFYDVVIVVLPGGKDFTCGLVRMRGELTAVGILFV